MKAKVKITNNISKNNQTKEVEVTVRNKEHLQIQLHNPTKIFKNKKKYTRKLKHKDNSY